MLLLLLLQSSLSLAIPPALPCQAVASSLSCLSHAWQVITH